MIKKINPHIVCRISYVVVAGKRPDKSNSRLRTIYDIRTIDSFTPWKLHLFNRNISEEIF